jgi:hypothetical protein
MGVFFGLGLIYSPPLYKFVYSEALYQSQFATFCNLSSTTALSGEEGQIRCCS